MLINFIPQNTQDNVLGQNNLFSQALTNCIFNLARYHCEAKCKFWQALSITKENINLIINNKYSNKQIADLTKNICQKLVYQNNMQLKQALRQLNISDKKFEKLVRKIEQNIDNKQKLCEKLIINSHYKNLNKNLKDSIYIKGLMFTLIAEIILIPIGIFATAFLPVGLILTATFGLALLAHGSYSYNKIKQNHFNKLNTLNSSLEFTAV